MQTADLQLSSEPQDENHRMPSNLYLYAPGQQSVIIFEIWISISILPHFEFGKGRMQAGRSIAGHFGNGISNKSHTKCR